MKTMSSWLLDGALAASLTWNFKLVERDAAHSSCAEGAQCAEAGKCTLEPGGMELDAEQQRALDELCARSCGESDRLERRADELRGELLASLSADAIDRAEVDRLVQEIGELRRRSLASCVDGILGVRELLGAERARELLESCGDSCCR